MGELDKLKEYCTFVNELERANNSIEQLDLLNDKKIKYRFAIDFSEIFEYFLPFLKNSDRIVGEEAHGIYNVKENIALSSLFNYYGTLVLLPPHRCELHKYIKMMEKDIRYDREYRKNKLIQIRNDILSDEKLNQIGRIASRALKDGKIDAKERTHIRLGVEKYFSKFKTLEILTNSYEIKNLIDLFKNRRIILLENIYPFYQVNVDDLIKKTRPWYEEFQSRRPTQGREYANYIDAMACVYLTDINKQLLSSKEPEILLFVSRSRIMLDILDKYSNIKCHNREIKISNNLLSILLLNINFIKDIALKDNLKNKISYYGTNIAKYMNSINLNDIDITDVIAINAIGKNIDNLFNCIDYQNNIGQFLYEYEIKKKIPKLSDKIDVGFENILSLFRTIYASNEAFQNEVENRIISLNEDIEVLNNEIIKNTLDLVQLSDLNKIVRYETMEGKVIYLEGILGELPIYIKIYDEKLLELVSSIFGEHRDSPVLPKRIEDYIKQIEAASGNANSNECVLLKSYIKACARQWEDAYQIISSPISRMPTNIEIESRYFRIFLCRKLEKTIDGIKESKIALELSPHEPRVLREYSVLLWQSYIDEEKQDNFKSEFGFLPTSEMALMYAKRAYEHSIYPMLKAQCLNSIAYFFADLNNKESIREAEICYSKIEDIIKEKSSMPARFLDTKAYIILKSISIIDESSYMKALRLNEALDLINEAISRSELFGKELEIVEKHKFDINKLILSLDSF